MQKLMFDVEDLRAANRRLSMLAYYPNDPGTQGAIMELLARMCPHLEALEWVVQQMVDQVGQWKGPAELRGVLCWKFRPADGVEANCSIPGFTPAEGERLSIERHEEIRRLEAENQSLRLVRGVALN